MRPEALSGVDGGLDVWRRRACIAWRCEVRSVVGPDRVNLLGDRLDQAAQEVSCGLARDLLMQLDEGELRGSVDRD
jgi:hypothetical protein